MKDIRAVKGRYFIQSLIEQGEHEHQDFKHSVNDARKIARSISAFANNDGGSLLIGVKDNGSIAGVRNEEDVYVVEQAAQMYCEPAQDVRFEAFKVDPGVIVIRATIGKADRRPVRVTESDGRRRAYFRVADENIAAHPLMVRAWEMERSDRIGGVMFTLTDRETLMLELIDSAGEPLNTDRMAIDLHMSRKSSDETVARLAALGIIEFVYDGHEFRIRRKE